METRYWTDPAKLPLPFSATASPAPQICLSPMLCPRFTRKGCVFPAQRTSPLLFFSFPSADHLAQLSSYTKLAAPQETRAGTVASAGCLSTFLTHASLSSLPCFEVFEHSFWLPISGEGLTPFEATPLRPVTLESSLRGWPGTSPLVST